MVFLEKIGKLFEDCVRNGTIPDVTHQQCHRYGTQGMCEEGALLFLDPSDQCNTLGRFQISIYIKSIRAILRLIIKAMENIKI